MKQARTIIETEFPRIRFPKLELAIDRKDGMYAHDHPAHYFYVAYSALACIQVVCAKQSGERVHSVLDFPCGHGRVLRALKAAFPDARLTACDLDKQGVDFCARTFGATGIYSNVDPGRICIQAKFDLIWVGSLFTWQELRYGVADLYRRAEVSHRANARHLEALASVIGRTPIRRYAGTPVRRFTWLRLRRAVTTRARTIRFFKLVRMNSPSGMLIFQAGD